MRFLLAVLVLCVLAAGICPAHTNPNEVRATAAQLAPGSQGATAAQQAVAARAAADQAAAQQERTETIHGDEERTPTSLEKRMQRERNKQRQKEIKRDTDRLLQLATELKLYVDKSDENMLSLDVIKKAGEIEKLAKSVREKMKGY